MSHLAHPLMLEGKVDDRDSTIRKLRDENGQLRNELERAQGEIRYLKTENARAIGALRQWLTPLFGSLKQVFGELDAIDGGGGAAAGNSASQPVTHSKWDAIKQRNPGRIADAIDILLVHGEMNNSQLAAAMRMDRSNCSKNVVPKLGAMGLLLRNGNKFSLKEL